MLLFISPLASCSFSIPWATRRRRRDVIVGLSFGQLFFLHPLGYDTAASLEDEADMVRGEEV